MVILAAKSGDSPGALLFSPERSAARRIRLRRGFRWGMPGDGVAKGKKYGAPPSAFDPGVVSRNSKQSEMPPVLTLSCYSRHFSRVSDMMPFGNSVALPGISMTARNWPRDLEVRKLEIAHSDESRMTRSTN